MDHAQTFVCIQMQLQTAKVTGILKTQFLYHSF